MHRETGNTKETEQIDGPAQHMLIALLFVDSETNRRREETRKFMKWNRRDGRRPVRTEAGGRR